MSHSYTFPPIQTDTLPNGLAVYCIENHEQEALTIALQMPIGEFCDAPGFEGTMELTVSLLLKGPQSLLPEEFTDKFEDVGASLFTEIGDENCVIGCKMLSKNADLIIQLFWEMILHPGFRQKELARLKREMITGLQAETADPMTIAHKHFSTMVCSANHPAGRMHSMQSVSKIKLDHIQKCYDSFFAPEKSIIVIAGGFDTSAMRKLIAKSVETWTCKRQGTTVIGQPLTPFVKTAIKLVEKKDLTQTSLIIGHPMPGELYTLRNELALANYVLGGGNFSSRLMAHIRSKKGKTYGISSQISCNREFGVLSMSTSTQNDQVADMLESIHTVYREFADKYVTDEELEKAKQFAIGNMAFQLEGIVNISDKFLWLKQFDRDVSFVEQFESTISAISLDAVSTAIKTSFTGNFAIVAVGKKDLIYDKLTPYGEVSVVDFRSNPA